MCDPERNPFMGGVARGQDVKFCWLGSCGHVCSMLVFVKSPGVDTVKSCLHCVTAWPRDRLGEGEVLGMHPSLEAFHPVIQQWFVETFGDPTPPQAQGWPLIASGQNVLLLAPTGSGKTLAAFLNCLDWLLKHGQTAETHGVQVLYVSPLKALNNDIHKNLQEPLAGLAVVAERLGQPHPKITAAVRTGDTPSAERQRMLRKPPQILITTPESLFLMISSKARSILRTVRFVIIDEIHTLFPEKRGAHLAVTLERLQHLVGDEPLQRIGLSATMRPLEAVAEYLVGAQRPVAIVDAGHRKNYDLAITLPVPDLRSLPERTIWPDIYRTLYDFIQQHRTTLVFVNNRRLAERITANLNKLAAREIARTHHGSISKEMRLVSEEQLKSGAIPCIVATSSLELGIDVGYIDLVVQIAVGSSVEIVFSTPRQSRHCDH